MGTPSSALVPFVVEIVDFVCDVIKDCIVLEQLDKLILIHMVQVIVGVHELIDNSEVFFLLCSYISKSLKLCLLHRVYLPQLRLFYYRWLLNDLRRLLKDRLYGLLGLQFSFSGSLLLLRRIYVALLETAEALLLLLLNLLFQTVCVAIKDFIIDEFYAHAFGR